MTVAGFARGAAWPLAPVGALVDLENGYPFDSEDFLPIGQVPLVRIRDLTASDFETFLDVEVPPRAMIRDGDLVIGMDGDFNVVRWARGPAALNQRLCRLRATEAVDLRFVEYALPDQLKWINDTQYSTTVKHLSSGEIRGCRIPLPPVEVQQRIADFLDDQVACINSIVAARQRQEKLLAEEMGSETAESVERLRRTSPAVPLGRVLGEVDSRSPGADPEQLLSVSIHAGVVPRSSITDDLPRADSLDNYKRVLAGDIVLNRMRAFQGAVGVAPTDGVVSPDYAVLRPGPDLVAGYCHFLMRSTWFVGEMVSRLRGIGSVDLGTVRTPRVNVADLRDIRIPLPNPAQQRQEMEWLRLRQEAEQTGRRLSLQQTALLSDFKRSLITAAVTGAFDVSAASGRGVTA